MLALLCLAITYQILQTILLPFIAMFIFALHCKRRSLPDLRQRLGFIPATTATQHVIWIHAVSVGEVLSTQELINLIKVEIPHAVCYLTVGSVAGKSIAQSHIKADYISFLPYDLFPSMLLAYHRIKPKALIVVEAELWPNLLIMGRLKKIPLFVLNARINPRSLHRFMKFKWFFKTLNNCFTTIFAQSPQDKELFERIGVNQENIKVLGNLKAFNVIAKRNDYLRQITFSPAPLPNNTVLLAGSIHPGEVELYLNMFMVLKKTNPSLKLILAPRHFTWHEKLITLVSETGYPFYEWTKQNPLNITPQNPYPAALENLFQSHDILLVCKLGELFNLYPYANIYFLGGTFVPVGGHNLLESIVWGVPTFIGPQHQNCQDIADRLTLVDGVIKVTNNDKLFSKTKELLDNPALQKTIGSNSYTWVCKEATAVEKTLNILIEALKH